MADGGAFPAIAGIRVAALRALQAAAVALLAACTTAPQAPSQPEPSSPLRAGLAPATARQHMAASANPLATQAGVDVLRAGGSAVDAAVAMQMVLTLVEPQSSGIGGGAFLMHWDGARVVAWDGRETAPQAADERLFLTADGKPMAFYDAVVGGRSVGTPGVLRMLADAHRRHGRLPWPRLFDPALRLADEGFPMSRRLHQQLAADKYLRRDAAAFAYFYQADGNPKAVGTLLRNPALAATLRAIAAGGADAFYRGAVADDIVKAVQSHASAGRLTAADLAAYRAIAREPVCSDYKAWRVCGMPPPSSGGIAVAQMLGMFLHRNVAVFPPELRTVPAPGLQPQADAVHLFSEAGRLAFADRGLYVADSDFVPVDVAALLAPAYLKQRAQLIGPRSMGRAQPGTPSGGPVALAADPSPLRSATSHLSVVDRWGHAVAMTTTIEDAFGSRTMVRGFLLNNQLTDFSFVPAGDGKPVANRVQPGKRPRSSMAPTLVFERESGRLVAALGSPGGSQIINYVARTLVALLDWKLDVQQAIALPNFGSRNGPTEVERERLDPAIIAALQARGHDVQAIDMASGLQGIVRMRLADGSEGWAGGADPRREGTAAGD